MDWLKRKIGKFIKFVKKDNFKMKCFKEGRYNRILGSSYSENPYLPGTPSHEWWDGGWYAVNDRLKEGVCDGEN